MTIVDLLISLGSAGLAVFSLPTVLNKDSQVPRRTASIPTAAILTYFVPLFAISGLVLTSITIARVALGEWLSVAVRPGNKHESASEVDWMVGCVLVSVRAMASGEPR